MKMEDPSGLGGNRSIGRPEKGGDLGGKTGGVVRDRGGKALGEGYPGESISKGIWEVSRRFLVDDREV